ncbi:TIR domain-containing protein [Nocardia tengchongensis]|uniref:TIR domain-containing protein n=1 Tax=Nocardia tengchongensis TaxID=2055889 RepID=UPI0036C5BA56
MGYRNKTYVAFASENISYYRMMEAWRDNDKIEFDFYDAHDLYISKDSSKPETIKRNLRERMKNAKQVVLLGSADAKRKGGDGDSFLAHEIDLIIEFNLPTVIANIKNTKDRKTDRALIPDPLLDAGYYTMSVTFQPSIIMYALDNYPTEFSKNEKSGPYYYKDSVYDSLGL